jgi:hypothetical protein
LAIDDEDLTAHFRTRLFGFDKNEVRACLENVVSDHTQAAEQISWLTAELKSREAGDKLKVQQEITAAQIAQVLASAHRVAADVKAEAERAANQAIVDAQQEAAHLRSQAEADASALTDSAAHRAAALEAEIESMEARREAVQAALNQAATRLNEIAELLRRATTSPDRNASMDQIELAV